MGGGQKRPKEIKPAMVTKQKCEKEAAALAREVEKYGGQKKKEEAKKKEKTKKKREESSDEDEDEEPKKKKKEKAADRAKNAEKQEEEEVEEDVKMVPDLVASRLKYKGRVKLPAKALPR